MHVRYAFPRRAWEKTARHQLLKTDCLGTKRYLAAYENGKLQQAGKAF